MDHRTIVSFESGSFVRRFSSRVVLEDVSAVLRRREEEAVVQAPIEHHHIIIHTKGPSIDRFCPTVKLYDILKRGYWVRDVDSGQQLFQVVDDAGTASKKAKQR